MFTGQIVGALSPDEALRVDCQVLSRDVGLVRLGQPARVEIEAFPATQWGALNGTVASVAADSSSTVTGPTSFRVMVGPPANHLSLPNGVQGGLRKGMNATVRLFVARRSLLSLLHEDVSDWLRP